MSVTSVNIPPKLKKEIEILAKKQRRNKSWIIREGVQNYIEQAKQQELMLEALDKGLEDIQAGRVISGKQVHRWLDSLGTDSPLSMPKI